MTTSPEDLLTMENRKDNIVIKRVKKRPDTVKKESKAGKKEKFRSQYERQIKILAVLLILISFLTLLALISYSSADEANTQITFSEFLKLLRGNEDVLAKIQTTHNWLGLTGAIISDFLYNSTIGISVILIPLLVIYWSKYLLFRQKPDKKIIKITLFTILFALLFSTFFGIITSLNWLTIPKEFAGSFGFYTSGIMTGIFGQIGGIIIILLAFAGLTFIVFKISPMRSYDKIKALASRPKDLIKRQTSKTQDTEEKNDETTSDQVEDEEEDEPARILKNNIENAEANPDPVENPLKAFSKLTKDEAIDTVDSAKNDIEIKKLQFDERKDTQKEEEKGIESRTVGDYKNNSENEQIEEDNKNTEQGTSEQPIADESAFEEKTTDEDENINEDSAKKLVLTVQETITDETEEFNPVNPLSTSIHDREINYKPPTIDLLIDDENQYEINEDELKLNARILQEKLETFKIEIQNLTVTPGPVVTQYEFVPAPGIKISKIESLADDIAMALKARGIRIIAPIPGKGTVGIEIPNQKPMLVRFGSCIKSQKYQHSDFHLPICLGKTISGEVFVTDLAKMPHLLMAGATGTGKSVGINTIIASMLYKLHPKDIKFVIIDPKKVELTQYAALKNHFLACSPDVDSKIITDPQDAVTVLNALTAEMDLRYDILSQVGQRNIFDYNKKVRSGIFSDDKELIHKEMPYIIVIIDELADLMLTASKEVEAPIIRLAQLARAVGIHLVLATQRPSVDVITGIIKANFPARISYLVASKIDSRTILDVMGAEKLLGNGDLLFQFGGSVAPQRIQNAYLSSEEVERICEFIGNQKGYSQPYMLPSLRDTDTGVNGVAREDRDPLFNEAARLIVRQQQASVSMIQRRLKVGYARAGRIIDELEATGIVGPFDGSKARTVLIESEEELEDLL